jgi:hypothetical protein
MATKKKAGRSFECKFLMGAVIFYAVVGWLVYNYLLEDLGYRVVPDYDKNPILPKFTL